MSGTSHPEHREWCKGKYDEIVADHEDTLEVLDVGAGSGTYARAFREGEPSYWYALEVHEPYVDRYKLRDVYDVVVIDDARQALGGAHHHFDLVILGDVVEHVSKADGYRMIEQACRIADHVLLNLPIGEYCQGAIDGNEHEAHLATWSVDDVFAAFPPSGDVVDHVVGDVTAAFHWRRA